MSRPAFIFITTGLKLALFAIACGFTLFDKLHSVKKQFSNRLPNGPKTDDAERPGANQAGVMRMSDGPH